MTQKSGISKKTLMGLICPVGALLVCLVTALVVVYLVRQSDPPAPDIEGRIDVSPTTLDGTDIGDGIVVESIGRYAGMFVEDGTDETVSEVFALTVRNTSEKTVQYAHIVLSREGEKYEFDLTTVPAGAVVQLLEMGRKKLPADVAGLEASVTLWAPFAEEPSLCADIFEIEGTERGITVKNISDRDVTGQIYIYYKSAYGDKLIGGITYRAGVKDLAAGASATCYAGHYSKDYSKVLFVTYVP